MWYYGMTQSATFEWCGVVWSTPLGLPGRCGICMYPHSTKWHKKKKDKNKKVALHVLTHGAIRGCGLTSLAVCNDDKIRDIRERNVIIRSEIWTMNIRSLGFWDIRERLTLWRLILISLGCTIILEVWVNWANSSLDHIENRHGFGSVDQNLLTLLSVLEFASLNLNLGTLFH
jgi:hypothetical protein